MKEFHRLQLHSANDRKIKPERNRPTPRPPALLVAIVEAQAPN